jgi:hypothetical protein
LGWKERDEFRRGEKARFWQKGRSPTPCRKVGPGSIWSTIIKPNTIFSKMKRIAQLPLAEGTNLLRSCSRTRISSPFAQRCLHTSPPNSATVAPITASGPPPTAPVPSAEHVDSRVARRRKQAELLKKGQDLRAVAAGTGGGSAKHKRFWKDVHVRHTDGMDSIQASWTIHLL